MLRVRSVTRELERRIVDGVYATGQRVPTEPQLAEEFAVSRTTIRSAVGSLQARGLVSREQGRGTFVRSSGHVNVSMVLDANLSITEVITGSGRRPGTIGLSVTRERASEAVAAALRIVPRSECLVVRRTRTADGIPAVDGRDYLLDVPSLPSDTAAYEHSLYALLEVAHHRPVITGVAHIEAVAAHGDTATRLGLAEGAPLLALAQVHELAGGTPVMYSVLSLRSDVVNLYVRRGHREDGPLHKSTPELPPAQGPS